MPSPVPYPYPVWASSLVRDAARSAKAHHEVVTIASSTASARSVSDRSVTANGFIHLPSIPFHDDDDEDEHLTALPAVSPRRPPQTGAGTVDGVHTVHVLAKRLPVEDDSLAFTVVSPVAPGRYLVLPHGDYSPHTIITLASSPLDSPISRSHQVIRSGKLSEAGRIVVATSRLIPWKTYDAYAVSPDPLASDPPTRALSLSPTFSPPIPIALRHHSPPRHGRSPAFSPPPLSPPVVQMSPPPTPPPSPPIRHVSPPVRHVSPPVIRHVSPPVRHVSPPAKVSQPPHVSPPAKVSQPPHVSHAHAQPARHVAYPVQSTHMPVGHVSPPRPRTPPSIAPDRVVAPRRSPPVVLPITLPKDRPAPVRHRPMSLDTLALPPTPSAARQAWKPDTSAVQPPAPRLPLPTVTPIASSPVPIVLPIAQPLVPSAIPLPAPQEQRTAAVKGSGANPPLESPPRGCGTKPIYLSQTAIEELLFTPSGFVRGSRAAVCAAVVVAAAATAGPPRLSPRRAPSWSFDISSPVVYVEDVDLEELCGEPPMRLKSLLGGHLRHTSPVRTRTSFLSRTPANNYRDVVSSLPTTFPVEVTSPPLIDQEAREAQRRRIASIKESQGRAVAELEKSAAAVRTTPRRSIVTELFGDSQPTSTSPYPAKVPSFSPAKVSRPTPPPRDAPPVLPFTPLLGPSTQRPFRSPPRRQRRDVSPDGGQELSPVCERRDVSPSYPMPHVFDFGPCTPAHGRTHVSPSRKQSRGVSPPKPDLHSHHPFTPVGGAVAATQRPPLAPRPPHDDGGALRHIKTLSPPASRPPNPRPSDTAGPVQRQQRAEDQKPLYSASVARQIVQEHLHSGQSISSLL